MCSDVTGLSALLLISVSAIVRSITAVMALSRISNREVRPCRTTHNQLKVAHDGLRPLTLGQQSTMVLSCTMLLMFVMVMVVQHSSEIIPAASFSNASTMDTHLGHLRCSPHGKLSHNPCAPKPPKDRRRHPLYSGAKKRGTRFDTRC